MNAYGRHAHGRGRHRAPAKGAPLFVRVLVFVAVFALIVTMAPVAIGLGIVAGVVFGWMKRGFTKH